MRRYFHIVCCLAVLLSAGCVEVLPRGTGQRIELKVFCEDPVLTKSVPGVDGYNENLISWVDFFFYPGDTPTGNAVLHQRFSDVTPGDAVSVDVSGKVNSLFPEGVEQITVYAIANYPGNESDLNGTWETLQGLRVTTQFADNTKIKQDRFMMQDCKVLDLSAGGRDQDVVSQGEIQLERYASKLTVSVHLASLVQLGEEEWTPMVEGMQVYLMEGVNTVKLSGRDPAPGYFDYNSDRRNYAAKNSQTGEITYTIPPTKDEGGNITFYNTYPMYMYPQTWEYGSSDKTTAFTCEPYVKLVVPWFRKETDNTFSTQRQCYYKVMFPESFKTEGFKSNNWYHLDLDISILGALTDEYALPVDPCSCIIVPWQSLNGDDDPVSHDLDVGVARFLFVERDSIVLRNEAALTIPYLTSHSVKVKEGSVHAYRLYYGTKTPTPEDPEPTVYNGKAIVRVAGPDFIYPEGSYYLDYSPSIDADFSFTVPPGTATLSFAHTLKNDYRVADFDYSPFTIFCTLQHTDGLGPERTVQIEQYPAIYIDRITNSDAESEGGTTPVSTESNTIFYSPSKYWGYVFVDGGAYWPENATDAFTRGIDGSNRCKWEPGARQNRRDQGRPSNQQDMFFKLPRNNSKEQVEYQWRTLWYTGGSLDIFKITVTELPVEDQFKFVLGDPRTYRPRDVNSEYKASFKEKFYDGETFLSTTLPEPDPAYRDGFAIAPSLYYENGEENRTLQYYLPADTTERTRNMLAPSYRISSKFSGVEFSGFNGATDITKEYATYRCAGYQEDGFPAGRWRLPTQGEITFIAKLSSNGVFAELFTSGKRYWSANGAVYVQKGGTVKPVEDKTALLRCVYDSWYWGDEQQADRNKFVWGDRPR